MPTTCMTTNWQACNEALKHRGSLAVWFDPGMIREAVSRRDQIETRSRSISRDTALAG